MGQIIKRVLNYGASYLYGIGSLMVPKKKDYYAFRLFHDPAHFAGNVRALSLYIQESEKDVEAVLLSRDKSASREAKKQGIQTLSSGFKQFWATLRAEHLIIDSYTGLYRWGNFSVIQLGHGAGYKNIGLLRDDLSDSRRKRLRKIFHNYKLVIATSPSNLKKKNASFGGKVGVITGYPRNDIFFEDNGIRTAHLKSKLGLANYKRIIGYAPTFRDYKTVSPFSAGFWNQLQAELQLQQAVFLVKKHPWDSLLEIPDQYPNIKDISGKIDAEELILIADWLVTDYSSIATDFAVTGKPILIYAYDYEAYKKNCRSVYYDLRTVLPQPFLTNERELLKVIQNPQGVNRKDIMESYKRFQHEFHSYRDGHSSARVFQEIRKL